MVNFRQLDIEMIVYLTVIIIIIKLAISFNFCEIFIVGMCMTLADLSNGLRSNVNMQIETCFSLIIC